MVTFYHNKSNNLVKPGCTSPNFANICLQKYSRAKFYPFTENDKGLLEKICQDMVSEPSKLYTRKAVVVETLICKSSFIFKSLVGIDARHLYPCCRCQPMLTRLYTKYEFDEDLQSFRNKQNKRRSLEDELMSYFQ